MPSFYRKLGAWIRFQNPNYEKRQLDVLLKSAAECKTFQEKAEWLIRIFAWIRSKADIASGEVAPARIPVIRLKYLIHILERNPEWTQPCAEIFWQFLCSPNYADLWADIGLSNQVGFFQELGERVLQKVLPETPLQADATNLFSQIFSEEEDAVWIAAIDEETLAKMMSLLSKYVTSEQLAGLNTSFEDSILFLMSQVRSFGLSSPVRSRLPKNKLRELPFFYLTASAEELEQKDFLAKSQVRYLVLLSECETKINEVYSHLDEFGVSISLVFQIERLHRQMMRMKLLLNLLGSKAENPGLIREFLVQFVEFLHSRKGVRRLLKDNFNLLAQKVVDRNSEIGEHYIVREKHEYWALLERAMGGGAVTVVTVYFKFMIMALPLTPFLAGLVASFNYAVSFVAIQLMGFTLGTKQPASTAPALARKIATLSNETMDEVCGEAFSIMKSQFVSVLGNLIAVLPLAIIVDEIYWYLTGMHFLTEEKAHYVVHSTDVLGPAVLYGAFTGILLFLSSVFAGWVDNWFVYRKVGERLAFHYRTRQIFGEEHTLKIAKFFQGNIAGLAANISLGVLLGLVPEIFKFLGIPLDVRHVTLSTGTLGLALPTLSGAEYFEGPVIRAVLGIGLIGFFNVGVSFSIALFFATNANHIKPKLRRIFYREFLKRFFRKPWDVILPNSTKVDSKKR